MPHQATVFAAALFAFAACAAAPQRIRTCAVQRSFDLNPEQSQPRSIEIFAYHGSVTLETGAVFQGEVSIDIAAADLRLVESIADAIELSSDWDGRGKLCLAVEPPIGASLDNLQTSYRLTVPSSVEVRVVTQDASVALSEFSGIASVRTGRGRIHADLDGGSCELTSGSGPIDLLGRYRSGVVSTHSGTVTCTSPVVGGNLSIACFDGQVTLAISQSDSIQFAFETDSGSFHSAMPVNLIERRENGRHIFVGVHGNPELCARAQITSGSAALHIVPRISTSQGAHNRSGQGLHLAGTIRNPVDALPLGKSSKLSLQLTGQARH